MRKKLNLVIAFIILGHLAFTQENIPTIRANSKMVDIRDGNEFKKNSWTIVPEINPDVYTTSNLDKNVTFYTDQDSISVKIKSTTQFDFIIILNDTTKALTQIKYIPSFLKTLKKANKYNDLDKREIPKFTYQEQDNSNLVLLI